MIGKGLHALLCSENHVFEFLYSILNSVSVRQIGWLSLKQEI